MNNLREVFQKYAAVVFFDTETSGLDADTCQIIELAAIRIEQTDRGNLRMAASLDKFVKLPKGEKLPEQITKLTGITDAERLEIAQVITAEAAGEPFAGKVAVAQCILQTCEDEGLRPAEVLEKYKYSRRRPEPTAEALEAVEAVFDFGHVATSEPIRYFYAPDLVESSWHESQVYVMTINNHRFFKENNH